MIPRKIIALTMPLALATLSVLRFSNCRGPTWPEPNVNARKTFISSVSHEHTHELLLTQMELWTKSELNLVTSDDAEHTHNHMVHIDVEEWEKAVAQGVPLIVVTSENYGAHTHYFSINRWW